MDFTAVFLIGSTNTFLSLSLTNHDDSRDKVSVDAEAFGQANGLCFMYLEDVEAKTP